MKKYWSMNDVSGGYGISKANQESSIFKYDIKLYDGFYDQKGLGHLLNTRCFIFMGDYYILDREQC